MYSVLFNLIYQNVDVDDDSNLVDLTFAGEDLDFLYVMSDKHLYKLTGQFLWQ